MGYVTREMIDRAKERDLLTYLRTYEPQAAISGVWRIVPNKHLREVPDRIDYLFTGCKRPGKGRKCSRPSIVIMIENDLSAIGVLKSFVWFKCVSEYIAIYDIRPEITYKIKEVCFQV